MSRTYGEISFNGEQFEIKAEPHVALRLKRLMTSLHSGPRTLLIDETPSNVADIEWFLSRYPLACNDGAIRRLKRGARDFRKRQSVCEEIIRGESRAQSPTVIPLRNYQDIAADLAMSQGRLLVGDDVGLGKTAVAFGMCARGALPCVIVCQTHLQLQWEREARKFLGEGIRVHIVKKGSYYKVPPHEILIVPYSKISGWANHLKGYQLICFDEAQELRRMGSQKYTGARNIASEIPYRIELTATPIYNYGDEIYNVLNIIAPGELGRQSEFLAEWCVPHGNHFKVRDPKALGTFLREQYLVLRRTRAEVGRELPPLTVIRQNVDFDANRIANSEKASVQLAEAILNGSFTEKGQATRELDARLRQATAIAKAPYVAQFVAEMAANGEKVLLGGWHREFYSVVEDELRKRGVAVAMYTGSETDKQKEQAFQQFVGKHELFEADVLMMSVRSGAGLDGIQEACSLCVFGELDWSPKVHDQFIGRPNRDGLRGPVTVVYLVAEGGSDPVIASALGLKREQSDGIVDPELKQDNFLAQPSDSEETALADLARSILKKHSKVSH